MTPEARARWGLASPPDRVSGKTIRVVVFHRRRRGAASGGAGLPLILHLSCLFTVPD